MQNNVILLAVYADQVKEIFRPDDVGKIYKSEDLYVSGAVVVRVLYCTLQKPREDVIGIAAINAAIARGIPAYSLRRIREKAKKRYKPNPLQRPLFDDL